MITESVTIRSRVAGADDPYGQPTYTWSESTVSGVLVAPRRGTEDGTDLRQAVIVGLTAYLPKGTVIGPRDQVIVRGDTYEVEGEPGDWRQSPLALGVEVALTRAEG